MSLILKAVGLRSKRAEAPRNHKTSRPTGVTPLQSTLVGLTRF